VLSYWTFYSVPGGDIFTYSFSSLFFPSMKRGKKREDEEEELKGRGDR